MSINKRTNRLIGIALLGAIIIAGILIPKLFADNSDWVKASVNFYNIYQQGYVKYDIDNDLLSVKTDRFTHTFSSDAKLKEIFGQALGVVKDELGDVYIMILGMSSEESFQKAIQGEDIKPYITLTFSPHPNDRGIQFKIEGSQALKFIQQGIAAGLFGKSPEQSSSSESRIEQLENSPELHRPPIIDQNSEVKEPATRQEDKRALFPGNNTSQSNTSDIFADFHKRLDKLRHETGHLTWGNEILDTEDMEWLMTLSDAEIRNLILKDKSEIEQEEEREVNDRAVFPGRHMGQSNQSENNPSNSPFGLEGRSLIGSLPSPAYTSRAEGKVVITIRVDNSGNVVSASYNAKESSTNESSLIQASIMAARQARFSKSNNDSIQTGNITYNFKLQ